MEEARSLLSESLSPRPDVYDPDAPLPGEVFHAELDLWHMTLEGNIVHAGGVTSNVTGVEGRIGVCAWVAAGVSRRC